SASRRSSSSAAGSQPTCQSTDSPGGTAPSNRVRCGTRFGSVTTTFIASSSLQSRALAVERPARHQVLHADGVVPGPKALLLVELVCGGNRLLVEIDAQ